MNYVGNHGYQEINQQDSVNSYAASGFGGLPTTSSDDRFGQVRNLNNQGYSNYDGLVSAPKWHANAFSDSFSYTCSHSTDTCSNACLEPFNALTAVSLRAQLSPLSLPSLNYGSSDYDIRHSLNANYVYTVPTSYFSNWAFLPTGPSPEPFSITVDILSRSWIARFALLRGSRMQVAFRLSSSLPTTWAALLRAPRRTRPVSQRPSSLQQQLNLTMETSPGTPSVARATSIPT